MHNLEKYFDILELKPGASPNEIKQAYRDLAQVWHPDRHEGNPRLRRKAEERFKEINEAYQKLTSMEAGPHYNSPPPTESPKTSDATGSPRKPEERPAKKHWGWTITSILCMAVTSTCINESFKKSQRQSSYNQLPKFTPTAPAYTFPLPSPTGGVQKATPDAPPSISEATPEQVSEAHSTPQAVEPNPWLPEEELKKVKVTFSTKGPISEGKFENNTDFVITDVTIGISKEYVAMQKNVVIPLPKGGFQFFNLQIPEGIIKPSSTVDISADIGHFLDVYKKPLAWGDALFWPTSKVTVISMRGYRE